MANLVVTEARGKFRVTLGDAVNVSVGTLLAYNGTNWVLADADTNETLYAQAVCLEARRENDDPNAATVMVAREAWLYDDDASTYTAGAKYYLSTTAGAFTATRPTADDDLVQVVGYAYTDKDLHIQIAPVRETHEYQQFVHRTSTVAEGVQLDSGNFVGYGLDANSDMAALTVKVPVNAVGLAHAFLHYAEEAEASTITLALSVSSAIDAAQWDAVTADTTMTAYDIAAAVAPDAINKYDVSTSFDATDIIRPGALLGVRAVVTLGGTDIVHLYGIHFVWNTV